MGASRERWPLGRGFERFYGFLAGETDQYHPDLVHDNAGYTPYAGRELQGWPVTVLSRGEVIVEDGKLTAQRGRGRFIARELSREAVPSGLKVPEMAQLDAWGTPLKL